MASCVGAAAAGCAERHALDVWRETVERYVAVEGAGDPAVVRKLRLAQSTRAPRPARVVIGALDVPGPLGSKRDARGVLAGVVRADGRTWYVFLVGITEFVRSRPRGLEEVRTVAFSVRDGALIWRTGPHDGSAERRYVRAHRGDADEAMAFPEVTDALDIDVVQSRVTIMERASGAAWEVDLAKNDDDEGALAAAATP
jgi:hypothetical protein